MRKVAENIRTLDDLRALRSEIMTLMDSYGVENVRIFGSIARGEATSASDIDFIVTFPEGTSIFDQIGLWLDLQELLGRDVDLLAEHPDGGDVMRQALLTAVPL